MSRSVFGQVVPDVSTDPSVSTFNLSKNSLSEDKGQHPRKSEVSEKYLLLQQGCKSIQPALFTFSK
jgi:hypothetical protein